MRELILAMSMSLDGFVSGPAGEKEWVFSGDEEAVAWKVDCLWNASLHIMGSRSFLDMAACWPTSDSVTFAPPMNQIPKAVFSKQPPEFLKAAMDGKPIVALGGATFARSLIARNLVDQYTLLVYPIALGKGLPIFADVAQPMRLKLVTSTVFPRGAVAQVYRRA